MTHASNSNVEPRDPGDVMIAMEIKGKDWAALTGEGLELPVPCRLQLVEQPGRTAGGWPTYGIRIVAP